MQFIFEQIRTGGDRNFGYLLGDREAGQAVLVDPSYNPGKLVKRAQAQGLTVTHIVNTHGHSDHTNGNRKAKKLTGAPLVAHRSAASHPELPVDHGDQLALGSFTLRFLHTPGHADDHVCVLVDDVCLTGDTLFVGKIGGTSTEATARTEYESLHQQLLTLPDATTVWPGHDYGCRPSSTIGLEKRTNPFLLCPDLPAFLELKAGWADYKKRHGLV
jgi:glyoxylase-like metal-dependent hydrolase (beta-lactamase superfamily II)